MKRLLVATLSASLLLLALFASKDSTVVLNQEGKVVTTWGKSR